MWRKLSTLLVLTVLVACGGGDNNDSSGGGASAAESAAVQCLKQRPDAHYSDGLHQPSLKPIPDAMAEQPVQSVAQCKDNTEFRFAAARADITGPAGGKIHMGNESPTNHSAGVYMRQYARAFVIESPCNGKRIATVLTDTGMMFESVRHEVLQRLAADPDMSAYGPDNVMLSATHTHSTPGGQAHYTAYNFFRFGHDAQTFEITVAGIVKALKEANANLAASQSSGPIKLAMGELLNTNKSRARPAYEENTEGERAGFKDVAGGDIDSNRLMTLLKLQRKDGKEVGSLNWFAVHPTGDAASEYGLGGVPISGDNKGYAAYRFERIKRQQSDVGSTEPFVSNFMQADEGDVFSIPWYDNPERAAEQAPLLDPREPSPVAVSNGASQLAKALELYMSADQALSGPVDYRFGYVQMDQTEITDPVVLTSLRHPPELDANPKRTCNPAMGISFPTGGGGNGPGEPGAFTPAGVTCSDPDYAQAVINDFTTATTPGFTGAPNVPSEIFSYAVGCNLQSVPTLNLECHAEKPILFVFGPPVNASAIVVPFQLFRIGNLAIIGLPWEVTTMSGRRIRQTVMDVLKDDGVDYAVITGLANDYVSYLTTREEYALQQYEGASTQFGPWTLAAVQQETRRLAQAMRDGVDNDPGPTPPVTAPQYPQVLPIQNLDGTPPGSSFGDVVEDVDASYAPGDTARVVFQASSPNPDVRTDDSFLWVERKNGDAWESVALDADPETSFVWHSVQPIPQGLPNVSSTAEILWRIPFTATNGTYRIRFASTANSLVITEPYEGVSSEFEVDGPMGQCP